MIIPGLYAYSKLKGYSIDQNPFSEWLYGPWSEEKYRKYQLLNAVPVVGNYMDYLLDVRSDKEYFKRYGMDFTDIHDPRKLRQSNSGSRLLQSGLNFVSENVDKLYR